MKIAYLNMYSLKIHTYFLVLNSLIGIFAKIYGN